MFELPANRGRALRQSHLVLPLGAVAVGSAVVALTCLAALIVVSAVSNADTLSTVALTLAIIAFVVQLIVFIVQSSSAAQQMTQAQELFGTMQGLLGKIGEQTAATQAVVYKMDDRFFAATVNKAIFQAELTSSERGEPVDARSVAADAVRSVAQTTREEASSADGPTPRKWPPPLSPDLAARRLKQLSEFPNDEVAVSSLLDDLEQIEAAPDAVPGFIPAIVKTFGQDERTSIEGGRVGPGLDLEVSGGVESVVRLGLAEQLRSPFEHLVALTDRGRLLARLLLASGEPPSDAAPRLRELQRRARTFEDQAKPGGGEESGGQSAGGDAETGTEMTAPADDAG